VTDARLADALTRSSIGGDTNFHGLLSEWIRWERTERITSFRSSLYQRTTLAIATHISHWSSDSGTVTERQIERGWFSSLRQSIW
jgi:hypothetical protein